MEQPGSAPLVSYLVTVFNKADVLAETLASIRAQRLDAPFEIVCADDASTDGSRAMLEAEAARDPRLRVVGDGPNVGPAIRINQAAAAARGTWLHPVDGDDLLPVNATAWLIAQARRHDAPLVFGRARRGPTPPPLPEPGASLRIDDPLPFAARRQITHMGFLASRALWRAAGGADEAVFIQDQSLPLRLAARAPAMVWTDEVVYGLRPMADGSLSRNKTQQGHDRALSALHVLRETPDGPAADALARMILSALWKLRRGSGGAAWLSAAFARYALNRATRWAPPRPMLEQLVAALAVTSGVRRP